MRGKSLINLLVGVSASWYCEGSWGVGGDESKENAKHQHEGTVVKKYSTWKGVAATVRVRLHHTSYCANSASVLLNICCVGEASLKVQFPVTISLIAKCFQFNTKSSCW